ncbi:MAG TPA: Calx-beta domain-containing protein, partial [Lysobacter sp.]|nr:Calx-beta domain-containing protein [Lysobacter sp.]
TRSLHPDFGGEESPGSTNIYGFPYVIVNGSTTAKQAVDFEYWDESDGVDSSGNGVPFYPIPSQAITQPHWIEGGAPGSVDQVGDRHLLVIDCSNHRLYELANVHYSSAQQRWSAVAGASFDLNSNARRPEGWTSSDASGMAIFPGLIRYDEAANPAIPEINHAFRVTVRATNGYVFPASHRAGSTSGALPMGARLRLKRSVNGADPALRTSDPTARKIFRAMQKYGLIVADNGSDMYISGTFDVRWDNGVLNPAFSSLKASDFEVVQLGWKPPASTAPSLNAVSASPNPVTGGQPATGTVSLSAAAPTGGAVVSLASASSAFSVPASVTVSQGASSANFTITTAAPATAATGTLSATYAGVTRTTAITVSPPAQSLPTLSIGNVLITEGNSGTKLATFTIRLSQAASSNVTYTIATANGSATASNDYVARSVTGQTIAPGQTSRAFTVTINGDTAREANESFAVKLSAVTGATVATSQATGVIVNDDGPTLSIGDISVTEGQSGTKHATFTVRLSQASRSNVTYSIATTNGSAIAGSDYVTRSLSGQTIAPGQTSRTFTVTINGDRTKESNETFWVGLGTPVGATILDSQARGLITNDD